VVASGNDESTLTALEERARRVRVGDISPADLSSNGAGIVGDSLFGALLRNSFDGVTLNARKSQWLIEVSDSFCELTGYAREELLGRTSVELGLVDPDETRAEATENAEEGREGLYETRLRRKDGVERWVEFSHQLLGDDYVLTIIRDVTKRRAIERQLRHMAHTDPLTGLFNRRRFRDEVERELRVARRVEESISLLLVDLDRLKEVNDEHGHQVGDRALCAVARGLKEATRETDIIGRIGGDEFAVLLTRSDAAGPKRVVEQLNRSLNASGAFTGMRDVAIEVSVGIATSNGQPEGYESLLAQADRAMYAEKG
jgi:diguanylate cyclase (GGDEF)-like protein/PAS domain S-box-containing protein